MAAWRYQLESVFTKKTDLLKGVEFANKWVTIIDGVITISANYAWDGCSPAYYVPIFGWIGTPDGPDGEDGKPQSYWATLVHDALCQFRGEIEIDKATAVALLRQMLKEGGFPAWRANLYAAAVFMFGPQDWLGFRTQVTPA